MNVNSQTPEPDPPRFTTWRLLSILTGAGAFLGLLSLLFTREQFRGVMLIVLGNVSVGAGVAAIVWLIQRAFRKKS